MGKKASQAKGRRVPKILAVLAGLLLLFAVGPRVDMDTSLLPSVIPPVPPLPEGNDETGEAWLGAEILEGYLEAREGRFDDIVPGTERTVVWANSDAPAPTEYVVVYFHGFSASRQETAPLSELLAERLGANLLLTRFSGHGRTGEAMAGASVNAWVNNGAEALELASLLGKRIVLVGNSTGATLAVWLAAQEEWDPSLTPWKGALDVLLLTSPNFGPRDKAASILLWPWGGQIAELVQGPERTFEPRNEAQGRFWTTRYPTKALLPMMGVVALARGRDQSRMEIPTMVFLSPDDEVVDPELTKKWFSLLGSPQKEMVEIRDPGDPSSHVLAGDILSPGPTESIAEQMANFVRRVR
jgi:alpha-beta hydrolase superfamily lysophospholipase